MSKKIKIIISKIAKKLRINRLFYLFCAYFCKRNTKEYDVDACRKELNNYYKKTDVSSLCHNTVHNKKYNLQIIIPLYNNEKYIEKCVESIISQKTNYKFCIDVIDDGSTDKSLEKILKYSNKINIIKKTNGGVSSARNEALKNIVADYIMFFDSDDYMNENSIERLLNCAYENEADIVQGSYVSIVNNKKIIKKTNNEIIERNQLTGFVWDKIIKSNLFENVCFPENYWFEDTNLSFLIYPKADIIYSISNIICIHNVNKKGLTSTAIGRAKSIDTYWICEILDDDRKKLGLVDNYEYICLLRNQFLVNYKRTYLLPNKVREIIFYLECSMIRSKYLDFEISKKDFLYPFIIADYRLYNLFAFWS